MHIAEGHKLSSLEN